MATVPTSLQWDPGLDLAPNADGRYEVGATASPSKFDLSKIDFSKLDPAVLKAIISAGGKAIAPTAASGAVSPTSMFTPEMRDQALAYIRQYMQGQEGVYNAGAFAPGVNVTQTAKTDPAAVKKAAFIQFRMNKGDTLEQATKKANTILQDPSQSFNQKKGFVEAINTGQIQNLTVGPRGIRAEATYAPGGVTTSPESQTIQDFLNDLNMQSFGAASGLPADYAANERRALAAKGALTPQLLSNISGMNNLGLTDKEQANIDAIDAYYTKQYGDLVNKTGSEALGIMNNSGFTSSSLADDIWNDYSGKPTAEYAADVAAKMADKYNETLNARTNRLNTAQTAGLNTFSTVGATGGIDSLFPGNTSGADFGLFTDPQAAALAAQIQQANIGNRQKDQAMYQNVYTMPADFLPAVPGGSTGGGFSAGGAASGALSGASKGAAIGSIIPGVGSIIGGGIGALFGGFKGSRR